MRLVRNYPLSISLESGYTEGHFPGHPIVPAAVSLKWVMESLRDYLATDSVQSFKVRNFKCIEEVAPPCDATVSIYEKSESAYYLELKIGHSCKISAHISVEA
jgi:hypothetical protein